jgi:ribonuclease T1
VTIFLQKKEIGMNRLLIALLLFLGGLGVGYFWGQGCNQGRFAENNTENGALENTTTTQKHTKKETESNRNNETETNYSDDESNIPAKVLKILGHIEETGEAPEGYVGGRKFKNLEGLLPKNNANNQRINYQEWDVNPKIEGKNRGKERLVTGDDKSAYFTNDHYQSFKKIK